MVKTFLEIITRRQKTVGSAAMVLAMMVLLSRVLGLIRDRLLASYFAPDALGVYFAAFRIPNVIFELLVMGAMSSAFIPVYAKYVARNQEEEARRIAAGLINISLIVFVIIAIPLYILAPWLSGLIAPGFRADQIQQMTQFTRFMLFFQVIPLLVGNVCTGILQSHHLFLIPALAPVLYNVGIIIGVIFFTVWAGIWAPVYGVGIGAVLFVLIQVPALIHVGYRHSRECNPKRPGIMEIGKLMAPRTFGLAVTQIDTTVDLILASLLGARMVTIFVFAQQLQQLPIGLFGQTIAQAALPQLSFVSEQDKKNEFIRILHSAIHQILFLVLPASALFVVLRIPVVRLVYGASQFDWAATVATGMTLSAFSVSLFAQAMVQILARGFYAILDSKTPVIIGIVSVCINTLVSVISIMVYHQPIWALGVSTSIASIIHAVLLVFFMHKRVPGFLSSLFIVPVVKMGVAAIITGIALYLPLKLFDQLVFDTTQVLGLMLLTGVSGIIGLITYMFLSWVMDVDQVHDVLRIMRRIQKVRMFSLEPAQEVMGGTASDIPHNTM